MYFVAVKVHDGKTLAHHKKNIGSDSTVEVSHVCLLCASGSSAPLVQLTTRELVHVLF